MAIKLQFFGAARNVTGSCYLVEAGDTRILVDCGMYQERDLRERNWAPLPVPVQTIDAVLLTHAHLDHCGRIPRLAREGYSGPVYATPATADIAKIIMLDSAHIQEEDIKYKMKRHQKEGRKGPHPYEPLYDSRDAENACGLFRHAGYENPVEIAPGITAEFIEVGHILGSTSIRLEIAADGETRSILFSGDVGRKNLPILKDPAPVRDADYILVESTYGDRLHEPPESIPDRLENIITRTLRGRGNIVIPSFAVERTQELLYHLSGLLAEDRIPQLPVFIDSPMAVRVTEVFMRHPELFDQETVDMLRAGNHPCDFPGLELSRTVEESKAINARQDPYIVIAGSGMCTGGRIKHHLKHNVGKENNIILFVGYQAVGTLGRLIVDGLDEVRIHGKTFPIRAAIEKIDGFSAHADRDELIEWLQPIQNAPRKVFITHGEESSAEAFAGHLAAERGWETVVPAYMDEVTLD